ncbi:hypothetical protein ACFRDV_08750 [Streptomyces fagopyri]|uniref:hypothetical protein n=1 Tax=Streptomyces fagopyri TaxID=2662397 RepID=UPI00369AD913
MQTRGRRLKFTAVSAMVVLALTGFSTGRHGHSRHSGGGSGGGCSSSRQDHDSSSSTSGGGSYGSGSSGGGSYGSGSTDDGTGGTYRSRPTRRSTPTSSATGGSGRALESGTATLVSCASEKTPYATVEVRNPNGRAGGFVVSVAFKDREDVTVVGGSGRVRVSANGRATVRVPLVGAGLAGSVDHCRVEPRATPEN